MLSDSVRILRILISQLVPPESVDKDSHSKHLDPSCPLTRLPGMRHLKGTTMIEACLVLRIESGHGL